MARPQKEGLDYFALDVNMDDETELIEAQYGLEGFAIMIKMFQKIYSEGYYIEWDERQQLLFSNRINSDRNKVTSVINDCIKWGIFNKDLYEKYKILTSRRIQKHYVSATYKRSNIALIKDYLLIDDIFKSDRNNVDTTSVSDIRNEEVTVINDEQNTGTTVISDGKSTQSKVNKSKVNKNKVNKNIYGEFVSLSDDEYQKLVEKYGEVLARKMIQKLDNYKGSSGKTYKSDYRAILNWVVDKVLSEAPKISSKSKDDPLSVNQMY